jgi:heme exporter protein A
MPLAPNADRVLEAREASKFFGDLMALRKVSLRIAPGDSIFLYGPNGAGKTTLLRLLAGLARPNEGDVLFAGQNIHGDSGASKRHVGFASHSTFLYAELTVRENLRFTARLFGLRNAERSIDAVLERFKLEDRVRQPVHNLSRGYQQRVTLARAFLHDPEFLLLDEPFTGLDSDSTAHLEGLLRRLPAEGKALVFSTHNFEQGWSLARRLVALETGQLRYDGPLGLAPLAALGIQQHQGLVGHPAGQQ